MRTVEVRNIAGVNYKVQQLGAKEGRLVLARIIRAVGSAAEGDEPVARLAAALTDTEVNYLCDTFSKTTMVEVGEGREVRLSDVFDDYFAGKYGELMKWLWACVEVNFGSFLADVGVNTQTLEAAAQKAKTSLLQ